MVGDQEIKKENANMKVFPNPVIDNAYLSINSFIESSIKYKLIDQFGRSVFISKKINIAQGLNQIELPVDLLNNGIYFVMISTEDLTSKTIKFVVAK